MGLETDPPTRRRRTPGLRREEVCQLAGVGLSWYTWLEQGRDITPSPSVLDALARVFALSGPERGHLFDLAGVPQPSDAEPYPTEAPPALAAFVDGFEPYPSFLLNPRADMLAFNPAAARVIGVPERAPDGTRNLLWHLFTTPGQTTGRAETARMTVARFRAAHARRYDDPRFRDLIEALQLTWEVNVMAHVWAARALLPEMVARGDGYLLSTASAAGLLTQLSALGYSITKHAAVALAEWLHITYADAGIKVSCVCPQGVNTPMLRYAAEEDPVGSAPLLAQGVLEPEDVAEAIVQGIRDERFLILPHAEVAEFMAVRGGQPERWLGGMRRLLGQAREAHGAD